MGKVDYTGFMFPKPGPKEKNKKTKHWDNARKTLKDIFYVEFGIITCELRLCSGCRNNDYLSFAHIDKRRWLSSDEVASEDCVALGCIPCHDIIEAWNRQKMREYLLKVIAQRQERLALREKVLRSTRTFGARRS